jgi:lipoprotein-releasing system permease protein
VGCGLGAAIGIGFTLYINPIERLLSGWFGIEIFPRDVYYFKEIPVELSMPAVWWTCLGAIAIAVLSSLMPARRAAKLRTVEALRYE